MHRLDRIRRAVGAVPFTAEVLGLLDNPLLVWGRLTEHARIRLTRTPQMITAHPETSGAYTC